MSGHQSPKSDKKTPKTCLRKENVCAAKEQKIALAS
jgi:hypothetical protein